MNSFVKDSNYLTAQWGQMLSHHQGLSPERGGNHLILLVQENRKSKDHSKFSMEYLLAVSETLDQHKTGNSNRYKFFQFTQYCSMSCAKKGNYSSQILAANFKPSFKVQYVIGLRNISPTCPTIHLYTVLCGHISREY